MDVAAEFLKEVGAENVFFGARGDDDFRPHIEFGPEGFGEGGEGCDADPAGDDDVALEAIFGWESFSERSLDGNGRSLAAPREDAGTFAFDFV